MILTPDKNNLILSSANSEIIQIFSLKEEKVIKESSDQVDEGITDMVLTNCGEFLYISSNKTLKKISVETLKIDYEFWNISDTYVTPLCITPDN